MSRLLNIALVLLLSACYSAITPYRQGSLNDRVVAGYEVYNVFRYWSYTPWYRVSDSPADMPVFVVIDTVGAGCVVPGMKWAEATVGYLFNCPSRWRFPRL